MVRYLKKNYYNFKVNSIINNVSAVRSHLATPALDLLSALLRLVQEFLQPLWDATLPLECVWLRALQLDLLPRLNKLAFESFVTLFVRFVYDSDK
jgi:hypothetical protein